MSDYIPPGPWTTVVWRHHGALTAGCRPCRTHLHGAWTSVRDAETAARTHLDDAWHLDVMTARTLTRQEAA